MFFPLPFGGLRLPKFLGDFSVQAVNVSLFQPFTEQGQPLFDSLGLALPERFLAGFIAEQGLLKLRQNVIRDADRLQHLAETLGHDLFAEVRQIAFAAITRAAVIGVLLLLEFGGHGAIVIGAAEQTGKCELVNLFARPRFAAQHLAHAGEYFRAHKGRVRACVALAFPSLGVNTACVLVFTLLGTVQNTSGSELTKMMNPDTELS